MQPEYLLYLAYDEMPTEDEQIGKKQVVVNLTLAEYKVSFKIKTYSNYCNALNLPKKKKTGYYCLQITDKTKGHKDQM